MIQSTLRTFSQGRGPNTGPRTCASGDRSTTTTIHIPRDFPVCRFTLPPPPPPRNTLHSFLPIVFLLSFRSVFCPVAEVMSHNSLQPSLELVRLTSAVPSDRTSNAIHSRSQRLYLNQLDVHTALRPLYWFFDCLSIFLIYTSRTCFLCINLELLASDLNGNGGSIAEEL
jgi:hypothetical protein